LKANEVIFVMIESADQFVLLRTSKDINLYERAANESATEEIWKEVIERYPEMRVWVAHNKTVPLNILEILSYDEDSAVRHAVAMKRKCGQDLGIMQRLSQDPEGTVRMRIALNPKTPRSILEQLLNDEWSNVAEEAKIRLEEDISESIG
jgi:hypothetical protein